MFRKKGKMKNHAVENICCFFSLLGTLAKRKRKKTKIYTNALSLTFLLCFDRARLPKVLTANPGKLRDEFQVQISLPSDSWPRCAQWCFFDDFGRFFLRCLASLGVVAASGKLKESESPQNFV
jgi:hypothetical protein